MPLSTQVQTRIRTQLLIELTNVNNRGATTVDGTVLGRAAGDVEADLETYAGVEYDDNDPRIVAEAVTGVLLRLRVYAGDVDAEELTRWQERVHERLRMVTGNNRIIPKSSSQLTPTSEKMGSEDVRPFFDQNDMGDVIPSQRQDTSSNVPPFGR